MKYIFLMSYLFLGCSHQKLTNPSRSIASGPMSVCNLHYEVLGESLNPQIFRENIFKAHVTSSSGNDLVTDLVEIRNVKASQEIDLILKNLESNGYDALKLNWNEQQFLWKEIVYPKLRMQEELLTQMAERGDEVAEVVLRTPYGLRDKALEASVLLKNVDPKLSRFEIADRLRNQLKGCIK